MPPVGKVPPPTNAQVRETRSPTSSAYRMPQPGHFVSTQSAAQHGVCLRRDDFTSRVITTGTSTSDATHMADIDWDNTVLRPAELPSSGGERRILQLSASLAAGTPVSLRDTITGLDDHNTALLPAGIRHAAGWRSGNSDTGSRNRRVQSAFPNV